MLRFALIAFYAFVKLVLINKLNYLQKKMKIKRITTNRKSKITYSLSMK